jgi:hypothetical protein
VLLDDYEEDLLIGTGQAWARPPDNERPGQGHRARGQRALFDELIRPQQHRLRDGET